MTGYAFYHFKLFWLCYKTRFCILLWQEFNDIILIGYVFVFHRFCKDTLDEEDKKESAFKFLENLSAAATDENNTELLTSVISYTSFYDDDDDEDKKESLTKKSHFLLDLCSHVKDYETQTGRSVLPALQTIYQSAPAVWRINLSERKSSILLEVLKLQTEKKPVELIDCTDEESEVKGFLQCLPYISQLRWESHGENTTLGLICFVSIFSALS